MHSSHLVNTIQIISLSHKNCSLVQLGKFYLEQSVFNSHIKNLPKKLKVSEVMMISTCNRLMFTLSTDSEVNFEFKASFFSTLYPELSSADLIWLNNTSVTYSGIHAARHMFRVASSLDSLVIGEREIITQVRNGYEQAHANGLTGDGIRLLVKKSIESAKDIFTHSKIATNPVSVVSLAYRKLKNLKMKENARFLVIGAGVTNQNFAKYLKKHGFANFSVFNRTFEKAEKLATELNGTAHKLSQLHNFSSGFDVIVTCTGSTEHIIDVELYNKLLNGETGKKIIIDLAVPADISPDIIEAFPVHYIDINHLKSIAEENMLQRQAEVDVADKMIDTHLEELKELYKVRKLEVALGVVPQKVKEIRQTAINEVFAKELLSLDPDSRAVLDKMLDYMEKKYISVPMKLAKEILIEQTVE